jgi:predicted MFS family arabinose efflux permease
MSLAFAGALNPVLVFVIAGLNGLVRPSDLGVRIALVADNVASDQLVAAMGISRTTSDCARVAGALAGAGIFAAFGIAPAYVAVSSFYALGLLFTLAIPATAGRPHASDGAQAGVQRPSAWRDLREGLAYVWSKPQLLAAMSIAFLVNMTAYPQSNGLLPYVAKDIYRIDQTGLGYLVASFAFGALLGSVALSLQGSNRPARLMIAAALGWYTMLLLFAQMPGPYGAVIMLALAGFMQSLCMVTLAVLLLRETAEKFRGRVMGVRMLVIYSLPLGLLAAGALIDRIGFPATATLYSLVGLIFTLLIALRWRTDLRNADLPAIPR